jgi:hypothetical protein
MERESQGSGVDQHMKDTILGRRLRQGAEMEKHEVQTSPQVHARIGGVLYLITIVVGIFNEAYVKGKIIVSGDAMATAANLGSMESLWRLGIAGPMLMVICTVTLSLKSHDIGYGIGLLLFGPFFVVAGYLIFKIDVFSKGDRDSVSDRRRGLYGEWLSAHPWPRASRLRCSPSSCFLASLGRHHSAFGF